MTTKHLEPQTQEWQQAVIDKTVRWFTPGAPLG